MKKVVWILIGAVLIQLSEYAEKYGDQAGAAAGTPETALPFYSLSFGFAISGVICFLLGIRGLFELFRIGKPKRKAGGLHTARPGGGAAAKMRMAEEFDADAALENYRARHKGIDRLRATGGRTGESGFGRRTG